MDIVTIAAARKGSGGGASKEYVDEKVAALINDTTAALDKAYSSAKVEEKVAGEEITTTATGSDLTLSTSSGNLNALTVYGKSEVVNGEIISAGEGWATVDLGTLDWSKISSPEIHVFRASLANVSPAIKLPAGGTVLGNYLCGEYTQKAWDPLARDDDGCYGIAYNETRMSLIDHDYSNVADFVAHISGVMLAYQLADPTQGNAIAIKTDNGTGIDGTMAVFSTGTPLYGVSDTVRDVMAWDGNAGTVTKKCDEVDLGTATYTYDTNNEWFSTVSFASLIKPTTNYEKANILSVQYTPHTVAELLTDHSIDMSCATNIYGTLIIRNTAYNTDTDAFKTAMSGVKLVYELKTPTTEQLTSTENTSLAGLRTFEPQTHVQNNAGATMTVEAYAGTGNGATVSELKQDVQSEISALKITQSGTLTLTTAGWNDNAQTIAYAHDTAKRNVIDVDPSSVEEWANCGILATAETATSITFTCKTVPENALTFRVTSMGVN